MSNTIGTWVRAKSGPTTRPVLMGHKLADQWIASGAEDVVEARFTGDLRQALADLEGAAKTQKLNLPMRALRLQLAGAMPGVINVSYKLTDAAPAVQLLDLLEDMDSVSSRIAHTINAWMRDHLDEWAMRHGLDAPMGRLREAASPENIELKRSTSRYVDEQSGAPNYPLIARVIGEQLDGQEIFHGLGPCRLVVYDKPGSNGIELATRPSMLVRGQRTDRAECFSMVAQVRLVCLPYSESGLYLCTRVSRRVWAKKAPGQGDWSMRSFTGFVYGPDELIMPVSIERAGKTWELGREYATLIRKSGGALPVTIEEALQHRDNMTSRWWIGVPEDTRLYRTLAPRSTFEQDEEDVRSAVGHLLGPAIDANGIQYRTLAKPSNPDKPVQYMISLDDLDVGRVGAWLDPQPLEEAEDEGGSEESERKREEVARNRADQLQKTREQNQRALAMIDPETRPSLWVFGGEDIERAAITESVRLLFGDAVSVEINGLPPGTHGLKEDLDGKDLKPRARFDLRVKAWEDATRHVQAASNGARIVVLVVAPDRMGTKPEDRVNYHAGIHAWSKVNANVQYLLPAGQEDGQRKQQKARQEFLHRTQSALLDVLLAHAGVVFNAEAVVQRLITDEAKRPHAIYGIQVKRSRARYRSGEKDSCFVLFSRLNVATGITEISVAHRELQNRTPWMPLAKGLAWIGVQRNMHKSDDNWLRGAFTQIVTDALRDIRADDPHAVVMVDWQSTNSLWKGIRDADLALGATPRLGDMDLAREFEGLALLRLRSGRDTMTLRHEKRHTYDGISETGEPTGVPRTQGYLTTERIIVEMPELPEGRGHGHYIVSMGYPTTVQMPRGFSCYRETERMAKRTDRSGTYHLETMTPYDKDASIPASSEVTVMMGPQGVPPSAYALLATSLRLSYAHYRDWTRLPAPLFFQKKVEDYVIRYPEITEVDPVVEDEEFDIDTVSLDEDDSAEMGATADLFGFGVDDEIDPDEESRPTATEAPEQVNGALAKAYMTKDAPIAAIVTETHPLGADLISIASEKKVGLLDSAIVEAIDKRILWSMVRGIHEVRVAIPSFVDPHGVIKFKVPVSTRTAKSVKSRLQDLKIKVGSDNKITASNLLAKLESWLEIPQGVVAATVLTRKLGEFHFAPVVEIIEREVNPTRAQEDQINPYNIIAKHFGDLAEWAIERNHDRFLAWLIFTVAQFPEKGWVSALRSRLRHPLGSLSADALSYYVNCADAIEMAKAQDAAKRWSPIRIGFDDRSEWTDRGVAPQPHADQAPDDASAPAARSDADILADVGRWVAELEPCSDRFHQVAGEIEAAIRELTVRHEAWRAQEEIRQREEEEARQREEEEARRLEEASRRQEEEERSRREADARQREAEERRRREDRLRQWQGQAVARAEALGLQAEIGRVIAGDLRSVLGGSHDDATLRGEQDALDAAIVQAEAAKQALDTLAGRPEPADLRERMARTRELMGCEEELLRCVDSLVTCVGTSVLICQSNDAVATAESEVGGTDTPEASVAEPAPREESQGDMAVLAAPIEDLTQRRAAREEDIESATIESESTGENQQGPAAVIEAGIEVLGKLLDKRLYGLAEVQADALRQYVEESDSEDADAYAPHTGMLAASAFSLERLDCRSAYGANLHPEQAAILSAEKELPRGNSSPDITALALMGTSLTTVLLSDKDARYSFSAGVGESFTDRPELAALIHHIEETFQRNYQLRYTLSEEHFLASRVGEKRAREHEFARFRERASNWDYEPGIHSTFKHIGYDAAHAHIYSRSHPIGACLQAIGEGDVLRVRRAYESARKRFEKPKETFNEAFARSARSRADGTKLRDALRNIEVTKAFVEEFIALAERLNKPEEGVPRETQAFLGELNMRIEKALAEARGMTPRGRLDQLYQDVGVRGLECALRLFQAEEAPVGMPVAPQRALLDLPLDQELMPVLAHIDENTPALCRPEDVFAATRFWVAEDTEVDATSSEGIDEAMRDALQTHIGNKRFLPAFRMLDWVNASERERADLRDNYESTRLALKRDLHDARQRVTTAMSLDAVKAATAAEMIAAIESILAAVDAEPPIARPGALSQAYADFPQARAALSSNVLRPLEGIYADAKVRIERDLEGLQNRMSANISAGDMDRMRRLLEDGDAASIRTANEAMACLRENGALPARLRGQEHFAHRFEKLVAEVKENIGSHKLSVEALRDTLAAERQPEEPAWLAHLDDESRAQGIGLLDAWEALFVSADSNDDQSIIEFLRALGAPKAQEATISRNQVRKGVKPVVLDRSTFVMPSAADDELFVPPVLGTMATHLEAVIVRGNPGVEDLRAEADLAGASPVVLITARRLNLKERARIAGNKPVLIIDQDAILYAALNFETRLQEVVKIGVLTFFNNPFNDYNTAPAPAEMFFGRQQEVQRIQNASGVVVLYGGRRLGKSSLLSQVERAAQAAPREAAVSLSITGVDMSGNHLETMWVRIYEAMLRAGLVEKVLKPKSWRDYAARVKASLVASDLAKVYLLIDEVENLMHRELMLGEREHGFVGSLFQLTEDLSREGACRLVTVFAGLHNVARMDADRSNSNYGRSEAIALKPFTSIEDMNLGVRLIVKPLAAMGYHFGKGDEDLPMRIMSVCNMYPAFIQLYCRSLLDLLQNNRQDAPAPFPITAETLDAVESNPRLLAELREKFRYSLKLDRRYEAIALVLADIWHIESTSETGRVARGVTATEIRELCQDFCPQHFQHTGPGAYEALLDEMEKLNVITRTHGRYALRTANIAMMIGGHTEVKDKMNELAEQTPETARNLGERRVALGIAAQKVHRPHFPMPVAWLRNYLGDGDYGGPLTILVGNDLSGINDLKLIGREECPIEGGVLRRLLGRASTRLRETLASHRPTAGDRRRQILLVPPESWSAEHLERIAWDARDAEKSGMRVVLYGGPEHALELARLAARTTPVGEEKWSVVAVPPWSEDAIWYYARHEAECNAIAESDMAMGSVLAATCGFGLEVQELCRRISSGADIDVACSEQAQKLGTSLEAVYARIGMPGGFSKEDRQAAEMFLVGVGEGLPRHVQGDPATPSEELENAMAAAGIDKGMLDFLSWMGVIQEDNRGRWIVPPHIGRLAGEG